MQGRPPAPRSAAMQPVHVPFVVGGLVIAIAGGLVLGIALPLLRALGFVLPQWTAIAQAHGHLMAVGFVSLMVVGVAYHLVPAFSGGRPLEQERLVTPSLWLIAGGVLLRGVTQPVATTPLLASVMALGAWAEFAGAVCFGLIIAASLRSSLVKRDPTAFFFVAGAGWFVLQGLLGALWLTIAASEGTAALPAARDGLLVTLQFVGIHVVFILGVGVRSFPVFFGAQRIDWRRAALPFVALQVGLALVVVAVLATEVYAGIADPAALVYGSGLSLIGGALAAVTTQMGWWHPPSRLRPASKQFAVPLQLAMAWLTVVALALVYLGVRGVAGGDLPSAREADAVRHVIAIGVVLSTIVAMAQLVLPEFASERFEGRQPAWRGLLLGALLSLATVLRAGSVLAGRWLPHPSMDIAIAVAGLIVLGTLVTFAALYARGLRQHRALLERFARLAASGDSLPMAERREG